MAIKIEIIRTDFGDMYRNKATQQSVGMVTESKNKPGIYLWEAYGSFWGYTTKEKAHKAIQKVLTDTASYLGEKVTFIET